MNNHVLKNRVCKISLRVYKWIPQYVLGPQKITWHRNKDKEDDLEIVKPAWKPEKK